MTSALAAIKTERSDFGALFRVLAVVGLRRGEAPRWTCTGEFRAPLRSDSPTVEPTTSAVSGGLWPTPPDLFGPNYALVSDFLDKLKGLLIFAGSAGSV